MEKMKTFEDYIKGEKIIILLVKDVFKPDSTGHEI